LLRFYFAINPAVKKQEPNQTDLLDQSPISTELSKNKQRQQKSDKHGKHTKDRVEQSRHGRLRCRSPFNNGRSNFTAAVSASGRLRMQDLFTVHALLGSRREKDSYRRKQRHAAEDDKKDNHFIDQGTAESRSFRVCLFRFITTRRLLNYLRNRDLTSALDLI